MQTTIDNEIRKLQENIAKINELAERMSVYIESLHHVGETIPAHAH